MSEKKVVLVVIDDQELQQTLELLRQLPRKSRPLPEVIRYLCEELEQSLAKGYSYPELAELLAPKGIEITPVTLRQYMSKARKNEGPSSSGKPKRPRILPPDGLRPVEDHRQATATNSPQTPQATEPEGNPGQPIATHRVIKDEL